MREIPIHEETAVNVPANLGLMAPNFFLRELLLYELKTSKIYFTAFHLFYDIFV